MARNVWNQDRAERILWIHAALTDPDEIRPDHPVEDRQSYLLSVEVASHEEAGGIERFGVYVGVMGMDEESALFLTAFPMKERYRRYARNAGRRLYPPVTVRKRDGKKR